MNRFFKVLLRTSDVASARAFYDSVLGPDVGEIVPLHEVAVARGAKPHWLGHLEVENVDAAILAFTRRGAERLSPTWVNPEGIEGATMRDPGGAVLALARRPAERPTSAVPRRHPEVVFCDLNTQGVEQAKVNYAELFGWAVTGALDLGPLGTFFEFAWESDGGPVGAMSDIATRPGVHPHWLFHFRVDAVETAIEAVRAGGGSLVRALALPSGERLAVCDDPQGAAFALRERGASVMA